MAQTRRLGRANPTPWVDVLTAPGHLSAEMALQNSLVVDAIALYLTGAEGDMGVTGEIPPSWED